MKFVIINIVKIIETNCQMAIKEGQISLQKKMRVFFSKAHFKIHVINLFLYYSIP